MPRWLNHIAVIIDHAHRDLGPYLTDDLESYNLIVDSSPEKAQYWLVIEQDNLQERIDSVSSSTTPRQYELTYTVQFKLMHAKGAEIFSSTQISVTRQATINSDRILGSTQEEALLIDEMRHEAAIQIMNQVSLKLSKLKSQPTIRHSP